MGYNILITVRGSDDPRLIANMVAEIVEGATGQKCNVQVNNKKPMMDRKRKSLQETNRKLMR